MFGASVPLMGSWFVLFHRRWESICLSGVPTSVETALFSFVVAGVAEVVVLQVSRSGDAVERVVTVTGNLCVVVEGGTVAV